MGLLSFYKHTSTNDVIALLVTTAKPCMSLWIQCLCRQSCWTFRLRRQSDSVGDSSPFKYEALYYDSLTTIGLDGIT